jgi:hypothetical protein
MTRRQKWLQFSLRSFLAVVAALAIFLAWIVRHAQMQRQAVASIVQAGGLVRYDAHFQVTGRSIEVSEWKPLLSCLSTVLGPDYVSRVTYAELPETPSVEDPIFERLPDLEFLALPNVDHDVVKRLKRLGNLRVLHLTGDTVTDADFSRLKRELPSCFIRPSYDIDL